MSAVDAALRSSAAILYLRSVQKWDRAAALDLVSEARHQSVSAVTVERPAASPSLASVLQCIKEHESGNYTEHSHINDGSGAYQAIPSTWRTWSARAGYPGYAYEYLAPPAVQDAVISYMLTHGGAGNYSPKYGNDPCTVGMN